MRKWAVALLPLVCISLSTATGQKAPVAKAENYPSAADRKAIVQAVEDEIYAWGCQKEFEFVGNGTSERHEVRVYIEPKLSNHGGAIIYKFMPFGEIIRSFQIGTSGLAYVADTPQQGFGPERSNHKTVYMDDDDLTRDKERWIKATFVIYAHPDKQRLREARDRQRIRLGEMDYGPYKDCPL